MSSATGPTGIFTCSIVGVFQPQYIGIYANENEGEFDFLLRLYMKCGEHENRLHITGTGYR